jgi:hypothetical protein
MKRLSGIAVVVAALVLGACGASSSPSATVSSGTGFLGEQSANANQDQQAEIHVPRAFAHADLLVALVAADGPDSFPATRYRSATTAVFGGSSGLHWQRAAHVSARHDVHARHEFRERYGASVAEIWTAVPPPAWHAGGTITCITNHPKSGDDGTALTIAAFAHGRLARTQTKDGLHTRAERLTTPVGAGDDLLAALFEGRMNSDFIPLPGYRTVVQRRAGDDTASVLESDNRSLPAGAQTVGFASPNPGDYWEMAVAVIAPG